MKITRFLLVKWTIISFNFILCLITTSASTEQSLVPFIMEYFEMRSIAAVNVFLCTTDGEKTLLPTRNAEDVARRTVNVKSLINFEPSDFKNLLEAQHHRIGVILDMSCSSSWQLLKTASDELLLNTTFVYALILNSPLPTILNSLEYLHIQFDSDLTVFSERKLYDFYRTAATRPLNWTVCGEWDESRGLSYTRPSRWNLEGVTIRATTVIKEFNWKRDGNRKFLDPGHHPEIDALSRFAIVTQGYMEFLCNFKTNLSIAPDWGYFRSDTGKFDEGSMFGRLEQGQTDLGLALSRMFSGRLSVAFWTPSTRLVKTCVLFRHPPAGASYDGFARPFNFTTWLVTFLYIFVSSVVLNVIRRRNVQDDPPNEPEFSNSLFHVLAVLSLQGSYIDSLRIPTRVLSVILHFFGLMVYSYYAAEVVGFLLTPSPRTLTTVDKLVESRMELWAENVSFHINHFESVVGAKATKYYDLAIKGATKDKDRFIDREIALKKVKKGGVAVYGMNTELFQIIESTFTGPDICSLYVMDMLNMPTSVAVRKKSPYREIYYKGLSRFIESGLKDYEDKKWHAQRPPCYGAEDSSPVELEATLIAQMIYVTGLIFAIVFFIVERLSPRNKIQKSKIPWCKHFQ